MRSIVAIILILSFFGCATQESANPKFDIVSDNFNSDFVKDINNEIHKNFKMINNSIIQMKLHEYEELLNWYFSKQKGYSPQINVKIIDSDEINAFSTLDGSIYITKGMVKISDFENEFFSHLCREVSHFIHRDHAKKLTEISIESVENNLFSPLLFARISNDSVPVSLSGKNSIFSYGNKSQYIADKDSVDCMLSNQIEPRGLISILQKISIRSKQEITQNYLDVMPPLEERIAFIRKVIMLYPPRKDVKINSNVFISIKGIIK